MPDKLHVENSLIFRDLVEKNVYVKSCIEKSDASQLEKRKRQKSGKRVKGMFDRIRLKLQIETFNMFFIFQNTKLYCICILKVVFTQKFIRFLSKYQLTQKQGFLCLQGQRLIEGILFLVSLWKLM